MTSKTRPYRDSLMEALADPTEAAHYFSAAIEDSHDMLLKALNNVARARDLAQPSTALIE